MLCLVCLDLFRAPSGPLASPQFPEDTSGDASPVGSGEGIPPSVAGHRLTHTSAWRPCVFGHDQLA